MAVDVAGYSRLMSEDEEGTLAKLRAIRRELGDPKIKEHRGRIVKTSGDGLLVDGALTADGLRLREEIEEHTDAMERPLVEAIGDDFDTLVEQLNGWSEQCIERKSFPPNMLKRAAG